MYPETPTDWRNVDRWPNKAAKERAYDIYRKLDKLEPADAGATLGEFEDIPALRFTAEAQELFNEWLTKLEPRLRKYSAEAPFFESHLAKYRSLMPALALLFYLTDLVDGKAKPGAVDVDSAEKAAAWIDYLELHARKVYAGAIQPEIQGAHALAEKIRSGKIRHEAQVRDIYRNEWSLLRTRSEVFDALAVLEEYGWVRLATVQTDGRPSEIVGLHPDLRGKQ